MSNKLYGRAIIKANGRVLRSKEGASLDMGGVTRETQKGDGGVLGFTEATAEAVLECAVAFGQGDRLSDFSWEDAMCEFSTDTGQTYILHTSWTTTTPKLEKGEVKLTINGPEAEELV